MSSTGQITFQLGYEISPIILTNGLAENIPGQMLPLVALTQARSFVNGLLQGSINLSNLDSYFAHFKPMTGATLINNQIGMYPFANQTIAANAIISQPLQVSLWMCCPVNSAGGYVSKLMTMSSLKLALDIHNQSGGTYTVVTPTYIYTNTILTSLKDISPSGGTNQVQTEWQWDFIQPLVTQVEATNLQNSLMNKISGGLPILSQTPTWSGLANSIGNSISGVSSTIAGASTGFTGTIANSVSQINSILGT